MTRVVPPRSISKRISVPVAVLPIVKDSPSWIPRPPAAGMVNMKRTGTCSVYPLSNSNCCKRPLDWMKKSLPSDNWLPSVGCRMGATPELPSIRTPRAPMLNWAFATVFTPMASIPTRGPFAWARNVVKSALIAVARSEASCSVVADRFRRVAFGIFWSAASMANS